jgi:hypothetical protein
LLGASALQYLRPPFVYRNKWMPYLVSSSGTEDVDPDARALDILNPAWDHAAHGSLRS